jgi:hypothetical protein
MDAILEIEGRHGVAVASLPMPLQLSGGGLLALGAENPKARSQGDYPWKVYADKAYDR